MRKIILSLVVLAALTGCGSNSSTTEKKEEVKDNTKHPDYIKGLALIGKSDCLTCHKVDEMHTGPSYRDVANRYAGASDTVAAYLAGKIIAGGKGVWGEAFMTPHPALSKEDAEAMVKYILLLKK